MIGSMAKTAAAPVVYGVLHSTLASDTVKRAAAGRFGGRAYNGHYRGEFYNAQAVAGLVALWAYVKGLPDRELYQARGPLALAMHRAGGGAGVHGLGILA